MNDVLMFAEATVIIAICIICLMIIICGLLQTIRDIDEYEKRNK